MKKIISCLAGFLIICFVVNGITESNSSTNKTNDNNSSTYSFNTTVVSDNKINAKKKETAVTSSTHQSKKTESKKNLKKSSTTKALESQQVSGKTSSFSISDIPAYSVYPYAEINNNNPYFTKSDITTNSYEYYSELDNLGRCGAAIACIGKDLMPTEDRGRIGMIKPTGWQTVKYDCIDGKYLYNRCHLIGYQLTAENANPRNLITGTRYLNVDGMLPFENMVADYINETGNHVLYRVTPIFEGNNLVASGVLMEAYSVEDNGAGICFNVYVYNVQPGIIINYADGSSYSEYGEESGGDTANDKTPSYSEKDTYIDPNDNSSGTYVINTSSGKFHKPSCNSVKNMSNSNKKVYKGKKNDLINQGYEPCKRCNP